MGNAVSSPPLSRRPLTASRSDRALFVDRQAEAAAVARAVELGLNTFVTGPAGSGKTSLLRHLQNRLDDAGESVVYANVESAESVEDVLVAIARAIGSGQDPSPSMATVGDETDLAIVEDAVANRFGERPTVLLVDGTSAGNSVVLFGRYRDRLWETPQLRWVVAGRHQAPPPPADAFFDRVVELEPFSEAAGSELLERRVPDIPVEVRRRLVEAIGTAQPVFWVLAAQSMALGETPDRVIAALADQRSISAGLPDRLRALYQAITEIGPVHAGDDELLERVGASRPWVVTGLKELEESGLVESERLGRRVLYQALRNRLVRSPNGVGPGNAHPSSNGHRRSHGGSIKASTRP